MYFEETSKSLGVAVSVEMGPDFLLFAAIFILRVLQLTPDSPKCLMSCGSQDLGKGKNIKAATKYNLSLVF